MEGFRGCLILTFREIAQQRSPSWSPQLQCIQSLLLSLSLKLQHAVVPASRSYDHYLPAPDPVLHLSAPVRRGTVADARLGLA